MMRVVPFAITHGEGLARSGIHCPSVKSMRVAFTAAQGKLDAPVERDEATWKCAVALLLFCW
jgi:hypothetical protein